MTELPTGTVTFLFTDIEGSTRLLKDLRDRYAAVLEAHQRLLREAFTAHDGIEIDTQGDSFFVVFRRAGDAVAAAVAAQRALAEHEWPDQGAVRVRMGLHTGEPAATAESYIGLGVHRAARISAAGHGGQVVLSNATRELVEDDLPNDVRLVDLGEHRLKDIDRPERLFQLEVEGLPSEFPPLKTLAHEPAVAAGRSDELAAAAADAVGHAPRIRRRVLLAGALAGVIAAAVAIPIFALGRGDSGPGIVRSAAAGANSLVILDTGSAQPISEVELPTTPLSAAAGEGAIWVTSADGQTVSRIDPETSSIRQSIRVGGGASGVAVGAGDVWVANGLEGTVSRVDADTNEVVQTIKVGNGPSGVAFGEGAIWVANAADHNVMRLDPGTGEVSDTIGVDAGVGAIAFGAGSVWVAGRSSDRVSRIDPRSKLVVEAVAVGRGPSALAVGGGAAWVANALEGTVSRIDVRTSRVTALAVGIAPSDVVVTGDAVWVTDEAGGGVVRIDPERNEVGELVSLGKRPVALVADGDRVYVALRAAGGAHRGGTLTVAATESVDFLDPARAYTELSWSVLAVVGDGLTGYRRVGGAEGSTLVPDLATSLPEPTDGGRTYTFQLRPRIRYSDGTPLRASDFRFALERVIEGRTPGSGFFSGIVGASRCLQRKARCRLSTGIVADDRRGSVIFRLSSPDPDFLYKLALPFAFAVPQTTRRGEPGRRPVLGTGPYRVAEYLPERRVILERNPRFREWSSASQPAGNPETIALRLGASRTEEVALVERGEADLAWNDVPPTRFDVLHTRYPGQLYITPGRATHFAFMNTRLPPFDDVRVRRALNLAADRAEFVRATGGETSAAPTCQVLPPNFPGYRRYCPYTENPSSSGEWTAPDIERAKRLVAAAGVRGTEVTLWFVDSPPFDATVEPLADLLRELGFRVRTKAYKDLSKYFDAINDSRTPVQIGLNGWFADYPSPGGFIDVQLSCHSFVPRSKFNANSARFCDRDVDRAISRAFALQGTDPRAAAVLWTQIDRMIVDRAPWLFTVNPKVVRFVSERVGNYQAHVQWGVLLDQLWVR